MFIVNPVLSAAALCGSAGLLAKCWVRIQKLQVMPCVPRGPTNVPSLSSTGCEIPTKPALCSQ